MTDLSNYYMDDYDLKVQRESNLKHNNELERQNALYKLERPEVKPLEKYDKCPKWGLGSCLVEFRGEIYEVTEKWLNGAPEYKRLVGKPLSERKGKGCFSAKTKAHLLRILSEQKISKATKKRRLT